jgi:hypothetical protein
MRDGNIILSRSLLGSPAWQDGDLWRLWCWCLFSAAAKAGTVLLDGVPVRVAAGQLAAPARAVCAGTGLDAAALRCSLAKGKNLGLLEVLLLPWGLRITIVNWQVFRHPAPASARGQAGPSRF